MKNLKIAVVGATGAVGQALMSVLEQRRFPVSEMIPFASHRSVGRSITFLGRSVTCRALERGCFTGVDLAFFDASDAVSKEWVPHAAESGAWVVDNSGTFRMDPNTLLIVPEVNGELLETLPSSKILTGPNCSTVQLVMALKPLRDRWGLSRVVVSTYQSTSGAGAAAMDELRDQTRDTSLAPRAFKHRIAFNCIPQIGSFKEDGYTSEEQKIMEETRKLLGLPTLRITATAVRVPTFSCHGESVQVECEKSLEADAVRDALGRQPGVIVQDEPANSIYPMGIEAVGRDAVYVGRVRMDSSVANGVSFWVVSDNLRKGAALNAVQIGEVLVRRGVFN